MQQACPCQCIVQNIILGCRAPLSDFVGLKNGGATCYMNAVFQQLFMQPSIRKLLLAVPELCDDQTDNIFYQMQVLWLCYACNLLSFDQRFYSNEVARYRGLHCSAVFKHVAHC